MTAVPISGVSWGAADARSGSTHSFSIEIFTSATSPTTAAWAARAVINHRVQSLEMVRLELPPTSGKPHSMSYGHPCWVVPVTYYSTLGLVHS